MTELKVQTKDDDAQSSLEHRFRKGSDAAFNEVIEDYSPLVRRLVHRLLAWDQEAEDTVQDVFVKAFVYRRRFRADASLKTWLYSIVVNLCRTRNRRRFIWHKFMLRQSYSRSVYDEDPCWSSLEREKADKVRRAAMELPMKYRDVIVLKYLEELETEQILEILKINEKAFYTRLNRARHHMQIRLADYLDDKNE